MVKIAFEGIDLSGKDTQLNMITEYLNSKNKKCNLIHTISDSRLGRAIRDILKSDVEIDKSVLVASFLTEIKKADYFSNLLTDDSITLYNRWYYSTLAYNSDDDTDMLYISDVIRHLEIQPVDYVIWLKIDPNIAIERLAKREGKDFERYEKADILTKVAKNYEIVFKHISINTNIIEINANQYPDKVFEDIIYQLQKIKII